MPVQQSGALLQGLIGFEARVGQGSRRRRDTLVVLVQEDFVRRDACRQGDRAAHTIGLRLGRCYGVPRREQLGALRISRLLSAPASKTWST